MQRPPGFEIGHAGRSPTLAVRADSERQSTRRAVHDEVAADLLELRL